MFGWLKNNARARAAAPHRGLLNLGCGQQIHPDWLNVDLEAGDPRVFAHDLRRPLPFPGASFSAVYHSHVLEHLPRREAPRFLAECWRVLEPGGILRVVVPDLEGIVRLYVRNLEAALDGDADSLARYDWLVIELLDQMVRDRSGGEMLRYWTQDPMPAESFVFARMGEEVRKVIGTLRAMAPVPAGDEAPSARQAVKFRATGEVHQWMYDRFSLGRLLADTGFGETRVCGAAESAIPRFGDYRFDVGADGSIRKPDSLFMEARKPANRAA